MKQKRIFSFLLALALIIGLVVTTTTEASAATASLSVTKTATIGVGSSKQLVAKFAGKNVTKKATWSTSNKSIATVKNGKVTAKKPGKVTIKVKYSGMTAKCTVTVMGLSKTSLTLKQGATAKLSFKVGAKAVTKGVKWSSSKSSVATVSNGVVKAVGKGSAVISAKYNKKAYKCKVTVKATGTTEKQNTTEDPNSKEKKVELNKSSASIGLGESVELYVNDSGEKVKSGVEWSVVNTSTTPKGSWGDINVTALHEATTMTNRGSAFIIGEYTGSAKVTAKYNGKTFTCDITVTGDAFNASKDVTPKYGEEVVHIDFTLKKKEFQSDKAYNDEILELLDQGCNIEGLVYDKTTKTFTGTVSETMTVTKDQRCETVEYTFAKLPKTAEEIKTLFLTAEKNDTIDQRVAGSECNYGGFNAMAATVCAANAFTWSADASDPFYSNDSIQGWEIREMFEFINGPYEDDNIAEVQMRTGIQSMKDAYQQMGENAYKVYFKGATSKNNYTPSEYTLTMYKGPYFINEKETINGTRPTTYMILIPGYETTTALTQCEGFASDRYIDVWYSNETNRWHSFQNNFLHITANNHKKPSKAR